MRLLGTATPFRRETVRTMSGPSIVWAVFPLIDLRPLSAPAAQGIPKPFSDPGPGQYLPQFGPVDFQRKVRGTSAMAEWLASSEGWYVSAHRFLRVPPPEDGWIRQPIRGRLYADGFLSARLELVFVVDGKVPIDEALGRIVDLPARVRRRERPGSRHRSTQEIKVSAIGSALREAYLLAVTRGRLPKQALLGALAAGGESRRQALEPLRRLDPLLIVEQQAASVAIRWGPVIRAGNADFSTLFASSQAPIAGNGALRRTFVRLHCTERLLRQVKTFLDEHPAQSPTPELRKRLSTVVQQASDGGRALQGTRAESIDALHSQAVGFSAAAAALGQQLLAAWPDDPLIRRFGADLQQVKTLWDRELRGPTGQRIEAGAGIFNAIQLRKIESVVVESGLAVRRSLLVAVLPAATVAAIPQADAPADQVWNDLAYLNGLGEAAPLEAWLGNAIHFLEQATLGGQAAVLKELAGARLAGSGSSASA